MLVTLNIGSRDIRLVAANEKEIVKWGTAPVKAGLIKDGDILQPQAVAQAIDSLFNSLGLPRSRVAVCIDGLSFTYRTIKLPRLKSSPMVEAIQRAARKEIPLPVENLYLEWLITGEGNGEVEVFALGAPRSLIDSVVETLNIAKVNLTAFGLKPLALARAAGKPRALIVDFEPDCFEIVIISEGMPAIMHAVTPRGEELSLEDNVSQLVNELNRTIDFHNITHTANPIASDMPILLSGSLALEKSAAELIKSQAGRPVETFTTQLPLPHDLPAALYASNIGLILKKPVKKISPRRSTSEFYDINIDLLNGRRRALAHPVSLRHLALPAVLVLLLILLIPLYLVRNNAAASVTSLQTELDRLTRNLRLARSVSDEAKITEANIQKLLAETGSLDKSQALISGKRDNSSLLRFIVGNLPAKAPYTALSMNSEQIKIDGQTPDRSDVINYATTLEKSGKFAGVRIAFIEEKVTGDQSSISFSIVIER